MKAVTDIIFLGSKTTEESDCSHKIRRHLCLGRIAVTNLDRVLKSRDITLPTKVCNVTYHISSNSVYSEQDMSLFSLCALPFSCVRLYATLWTVALQAPLSMGFPRQEHWRGLAFLPPGDLPDPGMELTSPSSPALAADSLPRSPRGSPKT